MTSRLPPQCLSCARWVSPLDSVATAVAVDDGAKQTCKAFPGGIPDAIWWNQADHRQPFDGDHGLQWKPKDGAKFPEWARP